MRLILRVRSAPDRPILPGRRPNRRLAHLGVSILMPLALFCFAVCGWRWSFELSWTSNFLVADGILSHWQIWFVSGGLLQALAVGLVRYAEGDGRRRLRRHLPSRLAGKPEPR